MAKPRALILRAPGANCDAEAQFAFEYGRIAFALKAIGRPVGQNDIMIAAIARTLGGCTVVTMDSDMSAIPGLSVENWVVDGTDP